MSTSSIQSQKKLGISIPLPLLAFSTLALFLLFLGLAFLKPNPLAAYIPLLGLLGLGALLFLRQNALAVAYALLALFIALFFPYLWREKALWELSICYSLALQFYTASLVIEELRLFFATPENPPFALEEREDEKKQLQEEISWLKEEAELRLVEKAALQTQLDQLLQEFKLAQNLLEGELNQKREELRKVEEMHSLSALELQSQKNRSDLAYKAKEDELRKIEEKSALLALELQNQKNRSDLAYKAKEDELSKIKESCSQLAEELQLQKNLREEIAKTLKVEKARFEEELTALKEKSCETKGAEQKIAQVQGLYSQLKSQFEEKSKILSTTRRELFQLEGKLLAFERESLLKEMGEEDPSEKLLLEELKVELLENKMLAEDVQQLEELLRLTLQG